MNHKGPSTSTHHLSTALTNLEYRRLFESAPGLLLVLDPRLNIVAVTESYLRATMTRRDEILGRNVFEVFPDNPNDPSADGVKNLTASLHRVLFHKRADAMAVQKYDIACLPEQGGGFEERYWSPVNSPVLGEDGKVEFIIHRVEDVTQLIQANLVSEQQAARNRQLELEVLQSAGEHGVMLRLLEGERAAHKRYESLVDSLGGVLWEGSSEAARCVYISPQAKKRFGYPAGDWEQPDFWSRHVLPQDRWVIARRLQATEEIESHTYEYRMMAADGSELWVRDLLAAVEQDGRTLLRGLMLDITAAKRAEEVQRQSQKMESIGLLAGGVAHDFNNMLGVIIGQTELAMMRMAAEDPLRLRLDAVKNSALKAAGLTSQLLAFSRQQVMETRLLDLNEIVRDTGKMLRRIVGEDIEMVSRLEASLGLVRADPGQMQQVIMNLVVNARDAMPTGGRLVFETRNVQLDEPFVSRHATLELGPYVMLVVSDTGHGMDAATQARIFEPFFTTKELGKGTGLGLATVFGIVNQSGGDIYVYSEVGQGTTFKIYLPRAVDEKDAIRGPRPQATARHGTETVVLVEDQEENRKLMIEILESYGYSVLSAENGQLALQHMRDDPRPVDLLLTDVIMPGMSGVELAKTVLHRYPNVRVIFMSGYTPDAVNRHGVTEVGAAFLQKPFGPSELALKVREVLDADGR